ncbi:PolC-type DNA polymerase III [Mycoplasma tauri]|uniref:PolC-type DNA polymerase III n=1 Tax=Mycoplasma tauri TaxID=547987 RepID=UPI001966DDED|nr:PolC-type DNA polymerase III [Mycoplasma tauri]QSB07520.1 PolC-type DNA polymerase III [Mycoplasma tauri]
MMNSNVKRFMAFIKMLNIEISPELENTELILLNSTYEGNEDEKLNLQFNFANLISIKSFKKFKKTLKKNKGLHVIFNFSDLQYTREILLTFIKEQIQKTRFRELKSIDWENIVKDLDVQTLNIETPDRSFIDQYGELLDELFTKLKNQGFSKLQVKYLQNNKNNDLVEEKIRKEKREESALLMKIARESAQKNNTINTKQETYKPLIRKKQTQTSKPYIMCTIEQLPTINEYSNVEFVGLIFASSTMATKDKRTIASIKISDYKSSVKGNWYLDTDLLSNEQKDLIDANSQNWVKIKATIPKNDRTENGFFVYINDVEKTTSPLKIAKDTAKDNEKRVEIHISTKMNTMDGLFYPDDFVKRAKEWGMPAIGIMDTDGAQSYPRLYSSAKKAGIKALYGTAFSTINRQNNSIFGKIPKGNIKDFSYVSFDIESTGLSPKFHELIEFGGVEIDQDLKLGKVHQFFVKSKSKLKNFTIDLTKITDELLDKKGIDIKEALSQIYEILNNKIALAHNAKFDYNFLKEQFKIHNIEFPNVTVIDTVTVSRIVYSQFKSHNLESIASRLGINYDAKVAHRGDYDAKVLANVWINMMAELQKQNIITFEDLYNYSSEKMYSANARHSREITTIALTEEGLKTQYKMISDCLTKNYINSPITYKEDLKELNRSDILIGSGTLKSELIEKYFYSCHDAFIDELDYYDIIEIPAPQCFEHWIKEEFLTQEQLYNSLKDIINEAKNKNKIVVATADVKYLDQWDKEIFESLVYAKGIKNTRHYLFDYRKLEKQGTLYLPTQKFLTTSEMIEQFSFLNDQSLINEVVVKNSQKIANMAQNLEIIKKGLYTPEFDDSKKKLADLVYKNAHEKYGDNLPELIQKRIDAELKPIIKYGFDVIYWISYKLVKLSVDQGFIVGSRGSIGSSFVASLIGISEVNPLPPHYNCSNCKHFELANIEGITSGYDLNSKNCPKCNSLMIGEGQSIPFETFLGFEADKVPDIDLNFTGEFQGVVHEEIRRLFGKNHTFRAGTISKVAEKTAFGYVRSYAEETKKTISQIDTEFIASRIKDVKRTTGQHPGGIIIIPKQFEIFDFTPINYPANDLSATWLTTHFDYKAIHDNVLKFDILGHDNPTTIKLLEEYTGIKIQDVPKNDKKVIDLFSSPKSMNINSSQISNEKTGAIGLPEFGTSFVRQMLSQIKPKSVADLISISGLSHGTNVWLNNAEELVLKKGKQLNEIICCRDDIMPMLIKKGIEPLKSFNIMEKVRKGKGLTNEETELLEKNNVPSWLIQSMKKIAYLFPKAHATAYVTMALWIAWFKLYKPLAFYASYFTAHSKADDIENMIDRKGGHKVSKRLKELRIMEKRSNKEDELINVFEVAEELYARGLNIANVSLEKSQASKWLIDESNNCLIPPFSSIESLGEIKANDIVECRNKKPFISKEDFKSRTGITTTVFDRMNNMGILDELEDSDQYSLF